MSLKKYVFLLIIVFSFFGFSQKKIELTPLSKISILTFGPGEDLYSKFGHTGIRIQEPSLGIDIVFDYGNFASFEDGFYWKFIQGQLNYTMGGRRYNSLIESYKSENRWVREQSLNLSFEEKKQLFGFLETNFLPENRGYSYQFFFDNCATKIPEILKKAFGEKIVYSNNYLEKRYTFRQLIRQKVKPNSWAGFGIDLALGSDIDKKATPYEHMFLPNYVYEQLSYTSLNAQPLVKEDILIYDAKLTNKNSNFIISPFFWLLVVLIIVTFVSYHDFKNNTQSKWLDFLLLFTTGAAGFLLFFLWFFTDHSATVNNFNILWAFPMNMIVAFMLLKKTTPMWISKYLSILLVLLVVTLIFWALKVQIFSPLLLLILIALAIRYVLLLMRIKSITHNS